MSVELLGVLIIQTLFVMIFVSRCRCKCQEGNDRTEQALRQRIQELQTELLAANKNIDALRNEKHKE